MKRHVLVFFLAFIPLSVFAQVTVQDPWVRATVSGQKATGAFMQISSSADVRLVSASSPVAGVTELHEMVMEKDIMKMRAVPGINIPAGRRTDLKPGGFHVMMMDLKQQIKEGDTVPITLVVEDKTGKRETLEVKAPARPLASTGDSNHGQHKH
jgi:copper(I)-binding protein